MRLRICGHLLGLIGVFTVFPVHGKDVLYPVSGGLITGEIEEVTPDFIKIKDKNESRTISVDTISRLRFTDDPAALVKVRTAVETGQLQQAKSQLQSLEPSGRDFVKQEVEFYRAYVDARLALQGRLPVNEAARLILAFLKSSPDSHRYYEACEIMGDLAMTQGRFDAGAKYYARLSNSKSPSIAARGNLLQGDAWLLQGDVNKAARLFQDTAKTQDGRLQNLGEIGLAVCMSEAGKPQEAIRRIEQIINENDSKDTELFARAYNGLGKSYEAAGDSEAALDAFLHTDLLFHRDSARHAEALYHLTKLWAKVNKPTEATRARQTLKEGYASSVWAKK